MYANVLFFLPLIAHEIWTWSQWSIGFVIHKRTPGFYHTMRILVWGENPLQPFSSCWYCAVAILLLRTSCCWQCRTWRKHSHTELLKEELVLGYCQRLPLCVFPLVLLHPMIHLQISHLLNKSSSKIVHVLLFYIKRTFSHYIWHTHLWQTNLIVM